MTRLVEQLRSSVIIQAHTNKLAPTAEDTEITACFCLPLEGQEEVNLVLLGVGIISFFFHI